MAAKWTIRILTASHTCCVNIRRVTSFNWWVVVLSSLIQHRMTNVAVAVSYLINVQSDENELNCK